MRGTRLASAAIGLALASVACATAPPVGVNDAQKALKDLVDPADFVDGTTIDNEWWPLAPGAQWHWEGEAFDEGERIERGLTLAITDLVKDIGGITTVIGYERDFNDGELGEAELIFLAQDKDGNVWHFGQYSEVYEDGELVGGSAWIAGHLAGAKPGIMVPAEPSLEMEEFSQGFAPAPYFWDDVGKVHAFEDKVCVFQGCHEDVLVIREFEPSIPGQGQLKYYARGVGNIKTGWDGNDDERESLELVSKTMLEGKAFDAIREAALELEARASVYGGTSPATQR